MAKETRHMYLEQPTRTASFTEKDRIRVAHFGGHTRLPTEICDDRTLGYEIGKKMLTFN